MTFTILRLTQYSFISTHIKKNTAISEKSMILKKKNKNKYTISFSFFSFSQIHFVGMTLKKTQCYQIYHM